MGLKRYFYLLKETYNEFSSNNLIHFASSLSFYILISMPSIVYVLITIFGQIAGHGFTTGKINEEIVSLVGKERAVGIQQLIQKTSSFNPNPVIKTLSGLFLLFTSTGVFITIQDTLNVVWKVKESHKYQFLERIKNRLFSFLMTMIAATVFILLMLMQALLTTFSEYVKEADISLLLYLNTVISFAVYTLLFALIFKLMSRVKLLWKNIWPASVVASVLFMIGKFLLIKYLAVMNYNSTYVAGAIIIILSWIFYSSYIFCFSAELLQTYMDKHKSSITLKPHTIRIETTILNEA